MRDRGVAVMGSTGCRRFWLWPWLAVLLHVQACAERPDVWQPAYRCTADDDCRWGYRCRLGGCRPPHLEWQGDVTDTGTRLLLDFGVVALGVTTSRTVMLRRVTMGKLPVRVTAVFLSRYDDETMQSGQFAATEDFSMNDISLPLDLHAAVLTVPVTFQPQSVGEKHGVLVVQYASGQDQWTDGVELLGSGLAACEDFDSDGFYAERIATGLLCSPPDCDDDSALCATDCQTDADGDGQRDCDDPCVDADSDSLGVSYLPDGGACAGPDCDDQSASCKTDCVTDADQDGRRDCDDPCMDGDADSYGMAGYPLGPGCIARDCDDTAVACTTDCNTDLDADASRDCDDPCVDADDDGYGTGPECQGVDCDDASDDCTAICEDVDTDGLRDCDADHCVDMDGDGFGRSDLKPNECVGADCDDTAPTCTLDCTTDVDQDAVADCRDNCLDGDLDGFGEGTGCLGADCDDAAFWCAANCEDLDGDGSADCAANCRDRDGDGFGEPPYFCDCGLLDCADCDPAVPTCTQGCAPDADSDGQDDCTGDRCTDVDGDGWSDCKDACIDADGDGWGDPGGQNAQFISYCNELVAQGLPVHPHCVVRCAGDDCDDSLQTGLRCNENCTSDFDGDGLPDCADECQDPDGDGYGADIVPGGCLGSDCDESNVLCNVDCVADDDSDGIANCRDGCVDADGDGYGQGSCAGPDCNDTDIACNVDCMTDADEDGLRDCADDCIDADGDSYGQGMGCVDMDCDDTADLCNADCSDADTDAIADCQDDCIDPDRDAYGLGDGCVGDDCLEGNVFCSVDCSDSDLDGEPDCAGDCVDVDGDSYCANADDNPDCDDQAPTCWSGTHDCQTDADGDGLRDCDDPCVDFDADGYGSTYLQAGTAGNCEGPDCDEGYATCNLDCATNADDDPYPDCRDTCLDPDQDGYGEGTEFGNTCLGADCLVSGQEDPEVFEGHPELCNERDDDCDGQTDESTIAVDDLQLCENQQGVCQGSHKPAGLCVDGHWQPCTTTQYQQQSDAYAGSETHCDGLDNDCDGQTDAADAELATDAAHDLQSCEKQTGVCAGCNKPRSLCIGGAWQPCATATYLACSALYQANGETTCNDTNNRDNDCDGKSNCADPDCAGQLGPVGVTSGTCEPTAEQSCGDAYDNDNDNNYDCGDSDCNGRACNDNNACTGNETCQYSIGSCRPGREACCSNNINDDQDGTADCADSDCAGLPGDAQGHLCQPAGETTCNDEFDNDRDGAADCSDSNCGETSTCHTLCSDGLDNDGNGQTDCADSDCNGQPGDGQGHNCQPLGETTCNDGFDNDRDGKLDCADTDTSNCRGRACNDGNACTGNDVCSQTTIQCLPGNIELCCSNNVSDDGDSVTDCADNDCNGQPGDTQGHPCQYQTETSCNDAFDNDRDGAVDCTDSNCSGMPPCTKAADARKAFSSGTAWPPNVAPMPEPKSLPRFVWAWQGPGTADPLPIWPLHADGLYAEQFYAYDGRHSDTGLEAAGELAVIVWADPDGWLNLVLTLDDGWNESAGGRCLVELSSVKGAALLVADDPDDGLEVDSRSGQGYLDWNWAGGDGAVIGRFAPDRLCLTLHVAHCDTSLAALRVYWGMAPDQYVTWSPVADLHLCTAAPQP